jgi:hypothetical protein
MVETGLVSSPKVLGPHPRSAKAVIHNQNGTSKGGCCLVHVWHEARYSPSPQGPARRSPQTFHANVVILFVFLSSPSFYELHAPKWSPTV